jgi:hypothetical protein
LISYTLVFGSLYRVQTIANKAMKSSQYVEKKDLGYETQHSKIIQNIKYDVIDLGKKRKKTR